MVDDVLLKYALSLQAEAPVHSFLVDCGNPNVRALFKEKDWNEIITLDRKPRPTLPNWLLRQLLECSRQESKAKMCKLPRSGWEPLLQLSNGDEDQEQDMDQNSGDGSEEEDDGRATAINPIEHNSESVGEKENITFSLYRAILNIFAEYASTSQDIRSSHGSEGWFSTHISGALIDGLLSDLPDVQLLRGEKMSISSSRRKNLGRDVATTKAHGHLRPATGPRTNPEHKRYPRPQASCVTQRDLPRDAPTYHWYHVTRARCLFRNSRRLTRLTRRVREHDA